jgi:UDP-3-O-[3-hydroxymyristoyl] glucosamine N-acyltransferase
MAHRLADLARMVGAAGFACAPGVAASRISAPDVSGPNDLSFFLPRVHSARVLRSCPALAVLISAVDAAHASPERALIVNDVVHAIARLAAWIEPARSRALRVRSSAVIDASAVVAPSAVLGPDVAIGAGSLIEEGVVIGPGVVIGDYTTLGPGASVRGYAHIGNRVHIGAGSTIGGDGFAFVRDGAQWLRVPGFGSVDIADDVHILDQTVIHAGVFSDTVIGPGCVLDSHVLIGHDARVGARTAIAGQCAIAGAAQIGDRCRIGGKSAIGEGVVLADDVTITAMSLVTCSIGRRGARYSSSWPAQPSTTWWRQVVGLRRWR